MEWCRLAHDHLMEMLSDEKISDSPPASADLTPTCLGAETDVVNPTDAPHVLADFGFQGGEREQAQQSLIAFLLSDEEHDRQKFGDLGSWNNILSADIGQLPGLPDPPNVLPPESIPVATLVEVAHHSASSQPEATTDGQQFADNIDDRSCDDTLKASRRIGFNRVRDHLSEEDCAVEYQRLRPDSTVDKKKGIPDDGHRHWKKYGNKSIESYTYLRGYYKCSLSDECKAKKSVTPTNNDPSTFEVKYKHEHTCTLTSDKLDALGAAAIRPRPPHKLSPYAQGASARLARLMPKLALQSMLLPSSLLATIGVQAEIAGLRNVDHEKAIATFPVIKVAGCKPSLPTGSTSISKGVREEDGQDFRPLQGVVEEAPYGGTESDSAREDIVEHDAKLPFLQQSSIDFTFTGHLFWPETDNTGIDSI